MAVRLVPKSPHQTLVGYEVRWRDPDGRQGYRPSSLERRESQIRTHLAPSKLGKMRLVPAVRPSDVQAFATDRDKALASEPVRGLMRLVSAVFAAAHRDRLISHNPCQRIALAPPKVERVVPLSVDQVRRLGNALPVRIKPLWIFQAATGLRAAGAVAPRGQLPA